MKVVLLEDHFKLRSWGREQSVIKRRENKTKEVVDKEIIECKKGE